MVPMEIQSIVSDLAGTMVDFGCQAPLQAFVQVFANKGVTITTAQAREPMGLNKKEHIRAILAMPDVTENFQHKHGRAYTEVDVDEMYHDFTPIQLDLLRSHAGMLPGVADVLQRLRADGIRIAVNSGYAREMVQQVVASLEQQGFVPDAWSSADDVPHGRPAPWMVLDVLQKMNVYPWHTVIKVGDTAPDMQEGRNASVWTVGVTDTGNLVGATEAEWATMPEPRRSHARMVAAARLRTAGAHYVIDSLADLPTVVAAINERLQHRDRPS